MMLALPSSLVDFCVGYTWRRDGIGRSTSEVFRLEAEKRPALYLKREKLGPFSELEGEVSRLNWLAMQRLPCPAVVSHVVQDGYGWLLMHALPGNDLASSPSMSPGDRVILLASALRRLHAIDIRLCPFDHRWTVRRAVAEARMRAGLVDENEFDSDRAGRSAAALFAELSTLNVEDEDLVVTHGDACLPNFTAFHGQLSGYIDCGRLGVADRYQDIALACRSIAYNVGDEFVPLFFRHYGLGQQSREKMERYQILDEFF